MTNRISWTWIACLLSAQALALLRIMGHTSEAFQAVAHLLVGGLFAAWLADRSNRRYLALAISLSVVEVLCFLALGRSTGHHVPQ